MQTLWNNQVVSDDGCKLTFGGTDKLPIRKIPPKANFFDLGRLRLHSHGTGKINMARVATSSDAVIP